MGPVPTPLFSDKTEPWNCTKGSATKIVDQISLQLKCEAGKDKTELIQFFLSVSVVHQLNCQGDQIFQTVFITLSIYVQAEHLSMISYRNTRRFRSVQQNLMEVNGNLFVYFNFVYRRQ